MEASVEELGEIHEVGPVLAQSVHDYFHKQGGEEVVRELRESGVVMTEHQRKPSSSNLPLEGKTLVVTGKLEHYSRDGIKDRIKDAGGRASSSVLRTPPMFSSEINPGPNTTTRCGSAYRCSPSRISAKLLATNNHLTTLRPIPRSDLFTIDTLSKERPQKRIVIPCRGFRDVITGTSLRKTLQPLWNRSNFPPLRILVGDFRKSLPGGSDRFINQFFRVGRGNEESFELTAGPGDPLEP